MVVGPSVVVNRHVQSASSRVADHFAGTTRNQHARRDPVATYPVAGRPAKKSDTPDLERQAAELQAKVAQLNEANRKVLSGNAVARGFNQVVNRFGGQQDRLGLARAAAQSAMAHELSDALRTYRKQVASGQPDAERGLQSALRKAQTRVNAYDKALGEASAGNKFWSGVAGDMAAGVAVMAGVALSVSGIGAPIGVPLLAAGAFVGGGTLSLGARAVLDNQFDLKREGLAVFAVGGVGGLGAAVTGGASSAVTSGVARQAARMVGQQAVEGSVGRAVIGASTQAIVGAGFGGTTSGAQAIASGEKLDGVLRATALGAAGGAVGGVAATGVGAGLSRGASALSRGAVHNDTLARAIAASQSRLGRAAGTVASGSVAGASAGGTAAAVNQLASGQALDPASLRNQIVAGALQGGVTSGAGRAIAGRLRQSAPVTPTEEHPPGSNANNDAGVLAETPRTGNPARENPPTETAPNNQAPLTDSFPTGPQNNKQRSSAQQATAPGRAKKSPIDRQPDTGRATGSRSLNELAAKASQIQDIQTQRNEIEQTISLMTAQFDERHRGWRERNPQGTRSAQDPEPQRPPELDRLRNETKRLLEQQKAIHSAVREGVKALVKQTGSQDMTAQLALAPANVRKTLLREYMRAYSNGDDLRGLQYFFYDDSGLQQLHNSPPALKNTYKNLVNKKEFDWQDHYTDLVERYESAWMQQAEARATLYQNRTPAMRLEQTQAQGRFEAAKRDLLAFAAQEFPELQRKELAHLVGDLKEKHAIDSLSRQMTNQTLAEYLAHFPEGTSQFKVIDLISNHRYMVGLRIERAKKTGHGTAALPIKVLQDFESRSLADCEPVLARLWGTTKAKSFLKPPTTTIEEFLGLWREHATIEQLGGLLASHRDFVRQAVAKGERIPDEVLNQYFEFAKGPKLPAGEGANAVINAVKRHHDRFVRIEAQKKALEQRITALQSELASHSDTHRANDHAMENSALQQTPELVALRRRSERLQAQFEQLQRDARTEIKSLITSSGKAQYTAHFDPEIPDSDRQAYQAGLEAYAAIAGARAGHRHVVVRKHPDNANERSNHSNATMTISMDPGASGDARRQIQTMVHEMAHGLELEAPDIVRETGQFVLDHTLDQAIPLNDAYGHVAPGVSLGYRDDEMTRVIKPGTKAIWDPYLARAYRKDGSNQPAEKLDDLHATEVMSMGMEQLHRDPFAFIRDHPEHFRIIWKLLRAQEEH